MSFLLPLGIGAAGAALNIAGNLLSPARPPEKPDPKIFEAAMAQASAPKTNIMDLIAKPSASLTMEQKQQLVSALLQSHITVLDAGGQRLGGIPENLEITPSGISFTIEGKGFSSDDILSASSSHGIFNR